MNKNDSLTVVKLNVLIICCFQYVDHLKYMRHSIYLRLLTAHDVRYLA